MPGEEVPGYRLLQRIGRGGSSTVYLADQQGEGFTRRVALKIVDRGPDSSLARRFRAEQRILATLEHPGIARLYDAGIAPSGRPYLAMELVEGETLLDYCRQAQTSMRERLGLFLAVLAAVEHAHAAGVVHRDLKPGNILVSGSRRAQTGGFRHRAPLCGGRWHGGMETTHTQHRAMTPAYASPEQVRGEAAGVPSDVYSLGVVLYELLTGRRPYRLSDASCETLARAIREQEPERPSAACRELRGDLRGDLDAILLKALRKEPGATLRVRRRLRGGPGTPPGGEARPGATRLASLPRGPSGAAPAAAPAQPGSRGAPAGRRLGWVYWNREPPTVPPPPNAPPWLAVPVRAAALESYRRGLAARARYDTTEALRHLRAAAAADPRNPLVRAALADVLSARGRVTEAAREGQRALALASHGSAAREPAPRRVGRPADRREGAEEAEILRSLRLLRPDDLEIGLLLARSLARPATRRRPRRWPQKLPGPCRPPRGRT